MDIVNCNSLILCHWLVPSVWYNIAQLIIKPHLATRLRRCGLLLQMNLRGLSFCRSVIILSPAKTGDPIEIPFWTVDSCGPREPCVRLRFRSPPREGTILKGNVICRANGWLKKQLKEQERQLFYIGIRALEKRRTKCISVAGNYVGG